MFKILFTKFKFKLLLILFIRCDKNNYLEGNCVIKYFALRKVLVSETSLHYQIFLRI